MKAKFKANQTEMQKYNSKIMQLLNLTELSDQEAELVIGGCTTAQVIDSSNTEEDKSSGNSNRFWRPGSGGGGGNGSGGGTGG